MFFRESIVLDAVLLVAFPGTFSPQKIINMLENTYGKMTLDFQRRTGCLNNLGKTLTKYWKVAVQFQRYRQNFFDIISQYSGVIKA